MAVTSEKYPEKVDLENCAKEPIHSIGSTQSHGVLIACDPLSLKITQAGVNTTDFFSVSTKDLLDKPLSNLLGEDQVLRLKKLLASKEILPQEVLVNERMFLLAIHFSELNLILEFEPLQKVQQPSFLQQHITLILNKFQESKTVKNLCNSAAELTRNIFGYDRVMIYKFDEEWNGEVVAERKEEDMESWLGLHYPATDIPEQSRALFLQHRVRMISDVQYAPVSILPDISPLTGNPLDLSQSHLRAVSPIHIEYLNNMQVGASLTTAIVVQGKLWGLIACHHRTPKSLSYYQRESCRFLTEMLSTRIALKESNNFIKNSENSERLKNRLVRQLEDQKDLFKALTDGPIQFTDLVKCGGGALYFEEEWCFSGIVPPKERVQKLLENFLSQQEENIYFTRKLSQAYPEAADFQKAASGVLSLRISQNKYIIWFRPEEVENVSWGGDPSKKAIFNDDKKRLSPRESFEKWSEQLTGISKPWQDFDLNAARTLGENISHFILARQREEINILNEQLMEANKELELFSYGLSHDLRAPVRGMQGYLQILREDFSDQLGEEGEIFLEKTEELTQKMNVLIDDILSYSHFSHLKNLQHQEIPVNSLIEEILELFNTALRFPQTTIKIASEILPVKGDRRMIFQLWANLLNNALKYSSKEENPQVEVGMTVKNEKKVYFIKDNGIGIEKEYLDKIFKSFTRVAGKDYDGTGIGLAIAKKIIEKHNGAIWVESTRGEGSTFYFYTDPTR